MRDRGLRRVWPCPGCRGAFGVRGPSATRCKSATSGCGSPSRSRGGQFRARNRLIEQPTVCGSPPLIRCVAVRANQTQRRVKRHRNVFGFVRCHLDRHRWVRTRLDGALAVELLVDTHDRVRGISARRAPRLLSVGRPVWGWCSIFIPYQFAVVHSGAAAPQSRLPCGRSREHSQRRSNQSADRVARKAQSARRSAGGLRSAIPA